MVTSDPVSAAPKKPPPRTVLRPATSREVWEKMVAAFRVHENQPNRFAIVGKLCGVHRDTAEKAYKHGLGREWSNTPIKDLLVHERAQRAAISTVLAAAKTADPSRPTDPEQAALAAALGETEFEQLRRATVAAVREEIAVVDSARRTALRAQKSGEMLGELLVQRAEALLKKYGATLADGKVVLPEISGALPEEVKILEGIGRLLRTLAAVGRSPIEMERLRIGDPETLRRRLDAVYGGDVGGAGAAGKGAVAEGAEEGEGGAEEPALPVEEVGDTDGWLGLRVIDGGKSAARGHAYMDSAGSALSETDDGEEDAASTDVEEALLGEDASSEVEGVVA